MLFIQQDCNMQKLVQRYIVGNEETKIFKQEGEQNFQKTTATMKIVYCLNSIRYTGGIQRVTVVKANALAEIDGNKVYVVVTDNKKGVVVQKLSPKVTLIDLDVNYYTDDWKSRLYVLKGILVKRREHKKKLTQVLNRINPDIVVSVGQSEKYLLTSIRGKWHTVRELHYCTTYRKQLAYSTFSKLMATIGDLYDYKYKIRKYDGTVLLTNEDRETNWKANSRLSVIPNPVSFITEAVSSLQNKRIIATGRLTNQKNFSSLIRAFKQVTEKHSDWILEIFGDGEQKQMLQQQIERLGLQEKILLRGYSSEVKNEMLNASILVCSSLFEGFGLVITEGMMCGLPVVSYNCPCGPSDIISEGEDGFLVPLNDETAMANRICQLIEDEKLRQRMGRAAKDKAQQYRLEKIIPLWMDLFNKLMKGK